MSRDTRRILFVRALRGFADGLVSVLLAGYLMRSTVGWPLVCGGLLKVLYDLLLLAQFRSVPPRGD